MTKEELQEILDLHKKWLNDEEGGRRANLVDANLKGADLVDAELEYAELEYANLRYADLEGANLECANLVDANLYSADLRGANLRYADLKGAELDYSCLPLCCGSLGVHFDDKQLIQILYHLLYNVQFSKNASQELKDKLLTIDLVELANRFHREECERIEV